MDIKDQIKAAQDLRREEVVVPEWGVTVYLRQLSAAELDYWQVSTIKRAGKDVKLDMRNASARLVSLCMVDADGKRIFGDDEADALGEKSAVVLGRLFAVAQKLNGLSQADVAEIKQDFLANQSVSFVSD